MYKKNKATKNNSLKKASISTAVAALASVAALSGVETFNPDSASMTFAVRNRHLFNNDFWSQGMNGFYGNGWGYGNFIGNPFNYYNNVDQRLNENQKENADIERKIVNNFGMSVSSNLSSNAIKSRIGNFCKAPSRVYDGVIERLTEKNEAYKDFVKAFKQVNSSMPLAQMDAAVAQCLKKLKDFKRNIMKQASELIMCYQLPRSADHDTAERLKETASEFKCDAELVKLANVKGIFEGNALEEARGICEKAIILLFEGKSFSDVAAENFQQRARSLNWYYTANLDLRSDKVSDLVRPLYAVLDVLLCTAQAVDDVVREFFAQQIVHNIRKYMAAMVQKGETDMAVAFGGKEYIGSFASMYGSTIEQTMIAPLLLSDDITKDKAVNMKSYGNSSVLDNNFYLKQALVESLRGGRKFGDVLEGYLGALASSSRERERELDRTSNDVEVSYDLAKLLEGAVGTQFARECLSILEALRSTLMRDNYPQLFGTPELEARTKAAFRLSDNDVKLIKEAKADFDRNGDKTHFVKSGGEIPSFLIKFGIAGQPTSYLSASGRTTALFYAGVPDLLKYSGLLEILIDVYDKRSRRGVDGYDNSMYPLIDENTFVNGVRSAMSAIGSLFEKTRSLMNRMASIKATEPYSKGGKVAKTADRDVRCVLPLNEGNLNIDKYKFDFEGGTLRLGNLPEEFKQVSVVVCPKNADKSNKSANKDFDGPVVDVRNGVATFDCSGLFTPGPGVYELHFRNEVKDDKGNVTDHKFFCKCKLVYKLDEAVHANVVQEDKVEQNASDSIVDLSSNEIYFNKDNSVTVKCKAGKDAPKGLTAVFFAEGVPANLEADKFGMELVGGKFVAQFPPVKKGKWQLHIYNGQIAKENYVGKIVFDTDKSKEIKVKESGSLADTVAIGESGDRQATVEKTLRIILPKEGFSNGEGIDKRRSLPYELVYSSGGDKALSSTMSLEYVDETADSSGIIYKAKVQVAPTTSEQKIVITDDAGHRIEAAKTVNSETGVNEKIDFNNAVNRTTKDDWFYNLGGLGNNLGGLWYRY